MLLLVCFFGVGSALDLALDILNQLALDGVGLALDRRWMGVGQQIQSIYVFLCAKSGIIISEIGGPRGCRRGAITGQAFAQVLVGEFGVGPALDRRWTGVGQN